MNEFWSMGNGELAIYTENLKVKPKAKIMAIYYDKDGKAYALQYKVIDGSKEHKELISKLKLTEKDRVRTRSKKTKKK